MSSAHAGESQGEKAGDGLQGPVGLRNGVQQVRNTQRDQKLVAGLLAAIPINKGGKQGVWYAPPLSGLEGSCTAVLANAIWDFQQFWKSYGLFDHVDGVVDPNQHTWRTLITLSKGQPVQPPGDDDVLIHAEPHAPGTWQITGMWSVARGDALVVGGVKMEITQPDGEKFILKAAGTGRRFHMGPKDLGDTLTGMKGSPGAVSAAVILETLSNGMGFSVVGFIQKLAAGKFAQIRTNGTIYPNPLRGLTGFPELPVSRQTIGHNVFGIASVSGGALAVSSAGVVVFGQQSIGAPWLADALAIYGSTGYALRGGGEIEGMVYHTVRVENV